MRLISHRGNLVGPDPETENAPVQIDKCLNAGLDCEIDVRFCAGRVYLGHDKPEYEVNLDWLIDRAHQIWIHCKDSQSMFLMADSKVDLNFFWHDKDVHTLTSKGYIWSYPGSPATSKSIVVLPEIWWNPDEHQNLNLSYGICTDFPLKFRDSLQIV